MFTHDCLVLFCTLHLVAIPSIHRASPCSYAHILGHLLARRVVEPTEYNSSLRTRRYRLGFVHMEDTYVWQPYGRASQKAATYIVTFYSSALTRGCFSIEAFLRPEHPVLCIVSR